MHDLIWPVKGIRIQPFKPTISRYGCKGFENCPRRTDFTKGGGGGGEGSSIECTDVCVRNLKTDSF